MISVTFLSDPDMGQKQQMIHLYHAENWWPDEKCDPEWITRILNGSHCIVIAMNNDEVVGMGRALSDGTGDAYLHDITVKHAYRRQGIGTKIISTLINRLTSDGITWIGLIAERNSEQVYKPHGFEVMKEATPMFKKLF